MLPDVSTEHQPRYRAHHIHLGEGYVMFSTQRGYVQFAQGVSRHFVRCATREVTVDGLDLPTEEEDEMGYRRKPLAQTTDVGTTDAGGCCVCNKPIKRYGITRMVHIIDGGGYVLHPQDEARYTTDDGDCLWFPIGPECAKRLGLEWTIKLEKAPTED